MRVFIGIPTHDGRVHVQCVEAISVALSILGQRGARTQLRFVTGSVVEHARNVIASEFLRSDATHLWFIDSDVGFDASVAERLLDAVSECDVVGGVYPRRQTPITFAYLPLNADAASKLSKPIAGRTEVAAVPMGCTFIRRRVIEELADNATRYGDKTDDVFRLFYSDVIDDDVYPEDFAFCMRWRERGGRVHALTDAVLTHTGHATFTGALSPPNKVAVRSRTPKKRRVNS